VPPSFGGKRYGWAVILIRSRFNAPAERRWRRSAVTQGNNVVNDRLRETDRSGWSLDEGWRQRANGSCFWGSCLLAPLRAAGEAHSPKNAPTAS
jgi:hypothetical protein